MEKIPKPVNRHVLIKNPITLQDLNDSITRSPVEQEEFIKEKFKTLFPDGTVKYEIVAVADDCSQSFKIGQQVSLTYGGSTRPKQPVGKDLYSLISEGDIGLIW